MSFRIDALRKADLDAYVNIMADAYPGLKIVSDDERSQLRKRLAQTYDDPSAAIFGLYQGGKLLAGMIQYEFNMNFRGEFVPVGGLGSLAVDLLHRKQKLAKEMVTFYLRYFRDRGICLSLLYPFRPDFYRRMGFGYGTKMNQYAFRTEGIRRQAARNRQVVFLGPMDAEKLLASYDRYAATTHGMISGSLKRAQQMLTNSSMRTVGYLDGTELTGSLTFDFEQGGHFLRNDLRVKQLIYEDSEALTGLLAFLRSLADQSKRIVLNTQDETFHHLLDDPANRSNNLLPSVFHESNTQGVGLMYRVLDLPGLFSMPGAPLFGREALTVKITLADSFLPENDGHVVVRFDGGRSSLTGPGQHDVEIRLDVSEFSSLIMGVITFRKLFAYGQAEISDARYVDLVSRLFATDTSPICMTTF